MIHDFSPADRGQPWFKKLKDSLDKELAKQRIYNDRTGLTAEDTAVIRGRIAVLKDLLKDMGEKPVQLQQPKRDKYSL